MPESSYFEVRCESCRTSFAPGTKRCVHCGAPLGRKLFGGAGGFDPTRTSTGEILGGAPDPGAQTPGAAGRGALLFRIAMIALVVITALVRACAER